MKNRLIQPKNGKNTEQLQSAILEAISDKKGNDMVYLDMRNIEEAVCDGFIICEGNSHPQVRAIANGIVEDVKKDLNDSPIHVEGMENQEWVLVDYFDIVVHIFLKGQREFYQLEELWNDAPATAYDENGKEIKEALKAKYVERKSE